MPVGQIIQKKKIFVIKEFTEDKYRTRLITMRSKPDYVEADFL